MSEKVSKLFENLLALFGVGTDGFSLDDAPSDATFDELFPPSGDPSGIQPQADVSAQPEGATELPAEPVLAEPVQVNPEDDFFMVAGNSRYKSKDDVARGIEHKDQYIAQLRSELEAAKAQPTPAVTPTQPTQSDDTFLYLNNDEKFVEDLTAAAQSGDRKRYAEVQKRLMMEQTQAQLAPFMPLVQQLGRAQAIEKVAAVEPQFVQFRNSPEFDQTLKTRPMLADAIRQAESNPSAAGYLPELYQSAYDTHLASLARKASQAPPVVRTTPTSSRPTLTPSAPPAPPAANSVSKPMTRAEQIKQMEERIGNYKF